MKLLLLCVCVALAHAIAPLRSRNGERAVPNSWIIKIQDGSDPSEVKDKILDVFTKTRTPRPLVMIYDVISPVLTLKVPAQLLDQVRAIDGIEYVQEDVMGTILGTQFNAPWGIDRVDARSGMDGMYTYNDNRQGAGVNIYIMDTGVQFDHNSFGGRASALYGLKDDHGHGTHCSGSFAGDIYGLARRATIYSAKVCNSWGQCPLSDLIAGFNAILGHGGSKNGAGVISISLGYGSNPTLNSYIQLMLDNGYTVSVAAGNSNANACNYSPAEVPGALTVGASDSGDARAYFSNWGSCVDLFAPGLNILSAGLSSSSTSKSATMSGTSMACPHVTGAAAIYLGANPGSSPATVHDAIVRDATSNVISDVRGSPNKFLYVEPN